MNIKKIEEIAVDVMEKNKRHTPQIMLIDKKTKNITCMLIYFDNEDEKDNNLKVIREKIHKDKIEQYFVVVESWIGQNPYIQPSKDPNKKEALIIMEYNKNNPTQSNSIFRTFEKNDNEIVWIDRKEEINNEQNKSRWNFYLEDVMSESIENIRLEQFFKENPKEKFEEDIKKFCTKMGLNDDEIIILKKMMIKKIKQGLVVPKDVYNKIKR